MHPSPYPICPFGSFCTLYKLKLNCGIHVQGVGRVLDRGGWFTMETVCHLSWAMECYISAADRWLTYIYSTLHPITSVLVLTSSKTTHWHTVCSWNRIKVVYFRAVYMARVAETLAAIECRSWVRARSLVLFCLSPYPVWAVEFTTYYR